MSELISPFDWNQVVVSTWTENLPFTFSSMLMGFLVTMACGLIGNFLILRRMALVGDAISHSVLPGLAVAFLAANAMAAKAEVGEIAARAANEVRFSSAMFIGAVVAALVTTVIIEVIHKRTRVKQDAAIGIAFTSLFAIGVIVISLFASKVHLDAACVLYGEIEYIQGWDGWEFSEGWILPFPVIRMFFVTLLTVVLILVFYKELLVSSFDSGLAASLGINANVVHYCMMGWLSIVVVSAFESVGAILVIAMLILPGATVSLLSCRLPVILWLSVLHAALSSVLGMHLAMWLSTSTAGAMVVVGAFLFLLAWLFSPQQGLLAQWWRRRGSSLLEPEPESTG